MRTLVGTRYPFVRAGTRSKSSYLNVPASFDIEVSSFYANEEKRATMYCWQFGIGGNVCMGRTWKQFLDLLEALHNALELSERKRLIIYVHNFAYEFQFIRKLIEWDKVFFTEPRKPLFAVCGGLEFRDSLKLSGGRSLEKIGKELRLFPDLNKAVGNLDYNLIRGSTTPLTEKEREYCELDVRVLNAYIYEKMVDEGGNIAKIPYTNTGYVRRYVREACFSYNWYRGVIKELTLTKPVYTLLNEAFQGGFTHASYRYVDKVLHNVGSFDKRSSYPSVMVAEKFPMGRFRPWEFKGDGEFQKLCKTEAVLFRCDLYGLYPINDRDHIISLSKCRDKNGQTISSTRAEELGIIVDNGRVVTAPFISITLTETDYLIFKRFYGCVECRIHDVWTAPKGYLPKPIVEATLKFFYDKTTLKGLIDKLVDYMISKNMINAEYGMMVTSIMKEILEYDNEKGYLDPKPPDVIQRLEDYNRDPKRFLYWAWGVWITSYARYNLLRVIDGVGDDHVYSDTDSDKILNPQNHLALFEEFDREMIEKLKASSEFFNIPLENYMPATPKGEKQIIGTWEHECDYARFKTLGAKRYLVQYPDGKYAITVAGLPKGAVAYMRKNWDDPFDAFNSDLYIPAEESNKLTLFYGDEPITGKAVDYLGNEFDYHEESFVHMESKYFTLNRSDQFAEFLLGFREVTEEWYE